MKTLAAGQKVRKRGFVGRRLMQERQTALKSFADVVAEERRSINRRRSGRRKTLQAPAEDATDPSHPRPDPCDAVGVALSGGGIRSAAFCLGVLQALFDAQAGGQDRLSL